MGLLGPVGWSWWRLEGVVMELPNMEPRENNSLPLNVVDIRWQLDTFTMKIAKTRV